jgi:hypothetical protein
MKQQPIHRRGAARAAALAGLAAVLHTAGAQAQVPLRRDLVIDGEFGFVNSLAVDAQGRIYVSDVQVQELHAFDARGSRLPLVGRHGPGPGEFQGLQWVVAARGDTLYTFDVAQQRITAFAPGSERKVAYTVHVPTVGRERASYQLLVPARGPFILPFSVPHGAQPDDQPRTVTLRTVDRGGRLGAQPLLRSPDRDAMVTRRGRSFSVSALPYGRTPFFELGAGDRLYYGWNDRPDVAAYDLRGRRVGAIHTRAAQLPVSGEDTRALLESFPENSPGLENVRLALREGRVPRTKPAYKHMLVDDRGRLWVNVSTRDDVVVQSEAGLVYASERPRPDGQSGPTPWWVFDPAGNRVAIYTVPSSVRLWQVRGGKAYGIEVDADGVQRVVRYAVGQ